MRADVLIVSEDKTLKTNQLVHILRDQPKRLLFVIAGDGRRAIRYSLKEQALREQAIEDLSATNLVTEIRAAAKEVSLQAANDWH